MPIENSPLYAALKILVLDDEPFMLRLLSRILQNLGFTSVATADNGLAALAQLDAPGTRPELILMDINMPHMDGVEFVRHLVERHYAGGLILVSGEDERVLQSMEKLVRAHQIAVLGRLSKPVTPQRLSKLIGKWSATGAGAARPARRTYLAEELDAAITKGELINHYQPKVSLASGALVGVESLVRWVHPEDGMVFPDQFIALAEQSGLIERLTRTVLQNALTQASIWHSTGLPLRIAVNLSMDNLKVLNFLDYVLNLTGLAGVAPQNIVLEITESSLMQDQRVPLEILTRLRLHHFCLSIDDFGTGNSSLSQLRDIPFDELKIDQSFVHGASSNATQRAMFDASLGLAKQLKMESVAEGVEDFADWNFVRDRRCDVAQGYFIGKPMAADAFPAWQADWESRRTLLMKP
jgi:EAL domain-containing protein (putative c-di-GMP-specific phosphodiesterase class I)/ActR/RegA family two-component response regulator